MQATILPYPPQDEFFIDEGCHIIELSNSTQDTDVSIAQARVTPGVTTRWHRLADTIERYVIISGTGVVEVGELAATKVNPGDVVLIPVLCRQRISNTGDQDLVFLAICSPRFTSSCYEDQARHATSRNSGTPVAVIRSPTQRIGDAPAALRPPQTEHKAAQSWLPQMALRLFGIKF